MHTAQQFGSRSSDSERAQEAACARAASNDLRKRQPAQGCAIGEEKKKGTTHTHMSVQSKIAEIKAEMDAMLIEYRKGEGGISCLRDGAMELLEPRGLIRKQRTSSIYVVVHPDNMYGDGLVPGHCIELACGFARDGFSPSEFGIPLATEVPPSTHPRHKQTLSFNKKMVADSNGILPPVEEAHCVLQSVSQP